MDTNTNTNDIRFTKIPNVALYTYSDKGESILEQFNFEHKVILMIDYLYNVVGFMDGVSRFSLEDMIVSCGYKPDTHKGQSNSTFKNLLINLQELNYISCDADLSKVKPKELIKCKLNFDVSSNFSMVYGKVRDKIYSVEGVDQSQLFTYYCYINARMHRRSKDEGNATIFGGEYEYTFFGYEKAYLDLHITDKAITKYNEILSNLDLIRYKNFGAYYYKNDKKATTRLTPNFYTIYDGDEEFSQMNLKEGYELFKIRDENDKKVFTDKPLVSDNRSIGGVKGSLKKKELNNTITDEEKVELQVIEEIIDDTHGEKSVLREIFKFMEVSGELIPLSEHYSYESETKGNDYLMIEQELGLINKDGSFTVSFDYYKDVMIEYNGKNTKKLQLKVMNYDNSIMSFEDMFS